MNENYRVLKDVLDAAFEQASVGKGAERHGNGGDIDFSEQPMQVISELLETEAGMAYQAIKKIREARKFPEFDRQKRELLGAIVYVAGMIIYLQRIDSIRRADADFDNAAQQLESLSGCAIRYQAEEKSRFGYSLAFTSKEEMEKFREAVERISTTPARHPVSLRLFPDMAERHRHNLVYVASYGKIINMKCGMAEKRSLIAELNRSFDENQAGDQNAPKVAPPTQMINEDVIIMVNKLQNIMVDAPESDCEGVAAIVNAGDYWETGNRFPDLYARRFVDVVKSQAMLHPNKTVIAKMFGFHNGYTLDLTPQRDHILELLDKGGMFTVTTKPFHEDMLWVVYNH